MGCDRETEVSCEKGVEGAVLSLCWGNVLRSQVSEQYLITRGIRAVSAAVGDISKQKIQGEVPEEIIRMGLDLGLDLRYRRIKQATPEMLQQAKYILVYCTREQLAEFMDPNDPRVRLMAVNDPPLGDFDEYRRAIREVLERVQEFADECYPDSPQSRIESSEWISGLSYIDASRRKISGQTNFQTRPFGTLDGYEYASDALPYRFGTII